MARRKKSAKLVAYQDGMVATEPNLPLPLVYYPGHYGVFLSFGKDEKSEIFFCSCSRHAIANYIRFRIKYDSRINNDPQINFVLSKAKFPQQIVKKLIEQDEKAGQEVIDKLNFKDEICHECN